MGKHSILKSVGAVVGLSAMLAAVQPAAAKDSFTMASLGSSSPTTTFSIATVEVLKKAHGYKVQLSTGTAAVRQAVDSAKNELDLFVTAVSIHGFMKRGERMYAKMADAKELSENLRGLMNYPLGAYQCIVWDDSGIKEFSDLKGKTVFTGPPSGAARVVVEQIIEGVTGYKPKQDFDSPNFDWAAGLQGFQDKQIDVYCTPEAIPSAGVAQLASIGEIRVLGIPEEALDSPALKALASVPGREFVMLPTGLYPTLVNEKEVRVVNSVVGLGTNKWMSEEDAYNITKAIYENVDDLTRAAAWMKVITPENGLNQMNMPLHVGAYKYYKEVGVDVPEDLIPPEAK
ncbi:MAG: C4-dicarboxylate ABC transporter substrate-binding protein [Sneathiella sp.]|uniref:TAXI family TRAP transporter solute-binding subunit n=1 Tax=Sneathiella sp. TaxID=1964365 RepID=UPI000C4923EC|nr:TAXI family TRAP transporter solute-binding subunit [Sneathiella sp.]MAL77971.1 C4-dicarboxylate ABC transporter substrate-binding protein [Sneathiella sp.]